jgi:hypothetical protein
MSEGRRFDLTDLDAFIGDCFSALRGADPTLRELRAPKESFSEWEADWFMQGAMANPPLYYCEVRSNPKNGFLASWVVSEVLTDPDGRPATPPKG